MDRKAELIEYIGKEKEETKVLEKLIDEMVYLEGKLEQLKKMPFLQIHPDNPFRQRATPAAKQYKELLQQYANVVKIVSKMSTGEGGEDDSPYTEWLKKHANN